MPNQPETAWLVGAKTDSWVTYEGVSWVDANHDLNVTIYYLPLCLPASIISLVKRIAFDNNARSHLSSCWHHVTPCMFIMVFACEDAAAWYCSTSYSLSGGLFSVNWSVGAQSCQETPAWLWTPVWLGLGRRGIAGTWTIPAGTMAWPGFGSTLGWIYDRLLCAWDGTRRLLERQSSIKTESDRDGSSSEGASVGQWAPGLLPRGDRCLSYPGRYSLPLHSASCTSVCMRERGREGWVGWEGDRNYVLRNL